MVLTLAFSCLAFFILLWAMGYTLQAYLYESIVEQLPLRAAIGGILLGCFYSFWTYVNTRAEHKDRFGVLQEFSPTAAVDLGEFTATRRYPFSKTADGKVKEEEVTYRKTAGSKVVSFRDAANNLFRPNDSQYLTTAITITANDKPVKLLAVMEGENVYAKPNGRSARFVEDGGKRFVEADQPGTLFVPSTAVLVGAITLNVVNYLIWVVAFWPCLRFTLGHSVAGAIGFGALMMLIFVPLLFQQNEVKKAGPVAVAIAEPDTPAEP
jgi:hypothetical protein